MAPRRAGGAGCWIILVLLGSAAFAGTPRPAQVVTTQRAVVAPQAFKPDDPVMKSPQAAKVLSATMVSATFDNMPALKAFAELTKQTGYAIEVYEGGGSNPPSYGRVTATINNQPFWLAVREICTRANVGLYYYGDNDQNRIQLAPANYGQQHMMKAATSIHGPYLTVATSLDRVNTVYIGAPEKTDRRVNVQLQNFAEPKARPTQYGYQPTIDEAVDDQGNSMVPDATEEPRHMQSPQGINWHGYVQLKYPTTNPGKRIARLRGHFDAKVQLQSEPWEIADPLKATEQSKTTGGKKITFKSFTKQQKGQYTAEFIFHRGENEDQQTFLQTAHNTQPVFKLIDKANARYQSYPSSSSGGPEEARRQFTFVRRSDRVRPAPAGANAADDAETPDPEKLVIEVPTAVQDVAIPFELVDLPLP